MLRVYHDPNDTEHDGTLRSLVCTQLSRFTRISILYDTCNKLSDTFCGISMWFLTAKHISCSGYYQETI